MSVLKTTRLWIVAAVLGLAAAAGAWQWGRAPQTSAAAPAPQDQGKVPVQVWKVHQNTTVEQTTTLTGMVRPRRKSQLSFELSGKLIEIFFDEGDSVKQGDVLARLDVRRLEAQQKRLTAERQAAAARKRQLDNGPRQERINAAMARVRQRTADFENARRAAERNEELVDSRSVSISENDRTKFDAASARAALEAAKQAFEELATGTREEEIEAQSAAVAALDAALEDISVQLDQSILRAPYEGVIAVRNVDEGSVLEAGTPVFGLVDAYHLEAHVGLPIDLAAKATVGMQREVLVEDKLVTARLRSVLPEVSSATQTRMAILDLEGDASNLPPIGAVARFEFSRSVPADGCWIPTTALDRGHRGLWVVWVIDTSSGRIEPRSVEVLHATGDRTFVRGALPDGTAIVASGIHRLTAGQQVEVIEELQLAEAPNQQQ